MGLYSIAGCLAQLHPPGIGYASLMLPCQGLLGFVSLKDLRRVDLWQTNQERGGVARGGGLEGSRPWSGRCTRSGLRSVLASHCWMMVIAVMQLMRQISLLLPSFLTLYTTTCRRATMYLQRQLDGFVDVFARLIVVVHQGCRYQLQKVHQEKEDSW